PPPASSPSPVSSPGQNDSSKGDNSISTSTFVGAIIRTSLSNILMR
ncbi:24346_t:CDS:1, partial [Dentiscutata erythropus]